jgi:hypothetical protein
LVKQLRTDITCRGKALDWVFSKFKGGDWNGVPITTDSFLSYINNGPQFLNGPKSILNYHDAVCGEGFRANCNSGIPPTEVEDHFTSDETALTVTPSFPFKSFWQPSFTPASSDGDQGFGVGIDPNNSGVNIFNEANVFHEALHGMTGKYDEDIYSILPGLSNSARSVSISIYIKNDVLGYCPTFR